VRWTVLSLWTVLFTVIHGGSLAGSWHYFDTGARALIAVSDPGGGLHLYHSHPELQFGPISLLAALPFTLLPLAWAKVTAVVVMSAAGLVFVALASRLLPAGARGQILLPALLFIPVWEELAARAGHLDDVLALTLALGALLTLRQLRADTTAVLLGLAVGAKPWALPFVFLLLALPADRRLRAVGWWTAVVAATWLPFVLGEPRTLAAAGFRIPNSAGSALRVFGVSDSHTPVWCRAAQLVVGAAVAYALWRRGRPAAILLGVIAVRLLLDPGTWSYYTAGLLAATMIVDLVVPPRRWPLPWLTVGAFVLVYVPAYVHVGLLASQSVQGYLRAGYLLAVLLAIFQLPMPDARCGAADADRPWSTRVTGCDARCSSPARTR